MFKALPIEISSSIAECKTDRLTHLFLRKWIPMSKMLTNTLMLDHSCTELQVPYEDDLLIEIVLYLDHHQGIAPRPIEIPLRSKNMLDVCADRWDANYIERIGCQRNKLMRLIRASNFFDIESLFNLACAKLASLMKGVALEDIESILHTDEDFHVEEPVSDAALPTEPLIADKEDLQ